MRLFISTLFFLLLSFTALKADEFDKWIDVASSYEYGKFLSAEQGCQMAFESAKQEAIRKVHGEWINSNEELVCNDKSDCKYYQHIWKNINGLILGIENIKRNIESKQFSCKVSMSVLVNNSKLHPDPDFNFSALLNQRLFKDGDKIVINIDTQLNFYYLSVFAYDPDSKKQDILFNKIFPNAIDTENQCSGKITIPTFEHENDYSLIARADGMDIDVEFIVMIATQKDINFLKTYDYFEFNRALSEIPANEFRMKKLSYTVLK